MQWFRKIPPSEGSTGTLTSVSPECLISEPSVETRAFVDPMRATVTMRDLLGCRSHSCPAPFGVAVGETWVASKPGGLNVRNSDDLETPAARSLFAGRFGEADPWAGLGEGRRCRGRNRQTHPATRRDPWLKHPEKHLQR